MIRTEESLRAVFRDPPGIDAVERRIIDSFTRLDVAALPDETHRRSPMTWVAAAGSAVAVAALIVAVAVAVPHLRSDAPTRGMAGSPGASVASASAQPASLQAVAARLGVSPARLDAALRDVKRAASADVAIAGPAAVAALARDLGISQAAARSALEQLAAADTATPTAKPSAGTPPKVARSSDPASAPQTAFLKSVAARLGVSPARLDAALGDVKRAASADGAITGPAAVAALARDLGISQAAARSALEQLAATDTATPTTKPSAGWPPKVARSSDPASAPQTAVLKSVAARLGVSPARLDAALGDVKRAASADGRITGPAPVAALARDLGISPDASRSALQQLAATATAARTPQGGTR